MVLQADVAGGALLSIERAGKDITGQTLEFEGTEVIDDVTVALTRRVAQADVTVHGTSVTDDPRPVLVFLFPEERARWRRGYAAYARIWLSGESTSSRETLIRLPPGPYLAVAIDDPNVSDPTRDGILEKLAPLAVPITLVAGQTTKVALRIANVSR
jgi:hypothetical protein